VFWFNILFDSGAQSVGGIVRLSAIMNVNSPFLEGRIQQSPLKPGFAQTLDGILSSDILEARDN
jgi:hypothetical protein